MDGFFWTAILLWLTMSAVHERVLRLRLRLSWGWWTVANMFAVTVGFFFAALVTFSVLLSFSWDLLKTKDIAILLGLFTIILAAFAVLTQWLLLRRQGIVKPLLWSSINISSAITAYILLTWLTLDALWKGDWKPVLASIFIGAILGAVTAKATDYYCSHLELLALQQTDEYWEEQAWKEDSEIN